jgi:D-glycero-D-manno-heptose 1,7-bisphosphate phosphatase
VTSLTPPSSPVRPWVLLDRDGTLNREVEYLARPEQLELLPGVGAALRQLQALGCRLIVVTNQSGIARGYFTPADLDAIHERLRTLLAAENVVLDGLFHCPHSPTDACRCRKPGTALFEQAVAALGEMPTERFMVGDRQSDLQFGRNINARPILLRTGYGANQSAATESLADVVCEDLLAASVWIASTLAEQP